MSILRRIGWANRELVTEARTSRNPLRSRIQTIIDKASLGNVPFYTITKIIDKLSREYPGVDPSQITDEQIHRAAKDVAALSFGGNAFVNKDPDSTRKSPIMWAPEPAAPGTTKDTLLQQSINKANATRAEKQANLNKETELFQKNFGMKFNPQEIQAAYDASYTNSVGIEIIGKEPFTAADIAAIRDVFDYQGEIEGDPSSDSGLPPNQLNKRFGTAGHVLEFDVPNDGFFMSSTINPSRIAAITNDFKSDIEDAIGRTVEVVVHPPTPSKEDLGEPTPIKEESVKLSKKQVDNLIRENAIARKQSCFRHEERSGYFR